MYTPANIAVENGTPFTLVENTKSLNNDMKSSKPYKPSSTKSTSPTSPKLTSPSTTTTTTTGSTTATPTLGSHHLTTTNLNPRLHASPSQLPHRTTKNRPHTDSTVPLDGNYSTVPPNSDGKPSDTASTVPPAGKPIDTAINSTAWREIQHSTTILYSWEP